VWWGDFNAVRTTEFTFNRFIDDNVLINFPFSGRKFTWYKGDGITMSHQDRFLLSKD
jgi:hypothetical protein